jgi:hypothetical protein
VTSTRDSALPALLVTLLGVTGLACASVPLVRPADPLFQASQGRLARTSALVAASGAPEADRLLFMQAEGFYRYRFEPPPRTLAGRLAVAAAAATDFPAFQSLAGALDMLDLRLRSYDGAVHLWETMLAQSPGTALRPLTLYRLGWAYRNTGASGLPRASGDQAWDDLMRDAPTTPLARLALEAKKTPSKSRDSATAWSAIPGLGQIYVGEVLNGSVRLTIGLASLAAIAVPVYVGYQRRQDLSWRRDWPLLVTGLAGLVVLSVDYTTAYQDAIRGVVDYNEGAEAEFETSHPDAP